MSTADMNFLDVNERNINRAYFASYEDLEVHQLMLKDITRTKAYKDAIFSNKEYLKGKTIMDVGAGTGILSVFCAQAGARKVYAVEASSLASLCESVVKDNKLSNVIQVLHNTVENVELSSDEKVDVIISEWMGFYLLHEGMLKSVLIARDKFLKPGGKIFPEVAELWCAPCKRTDAYEFWEDVLGVNMKSVGQQYRETKSKQPEIAEVSDCDLLSDSCLITSLDIENITENEIQNITSKHLVPSKCAGKLQGLCLWFVCTFPQVDYNENGPIIISTAPSEPSTHWKQTVVLLPVESIVEEKEPIAWQLCIALSNENKHQYDIQLTMLDPEEEKHPVPCNCYLTKCIVIKTFLEQCGNEPELEGYDVEDEEEDDDNGIEKMSNDHEKDKTENCEDVLLNNTKNLCDTVNKD